MNYQDYITKYLQPNTNNFLGVLNLKELLKSNQQTLMLFIFSVLLVIFSIGALSISVVHATIGNILFGFFFVLFLLISFLTLYQRFTHVLVTYVKDNKIFWEFYLTCMEVF